MSGARKIDVPSEHWDKLFAPSACLVMITTVGQRRPGQRGVLRHLRQGVP